MLNCLQKHFDNPDDIPPIPEVSSQFLQERLNPVYLSRIGALDGLRRAGFTEAGVLGFLEGVMAAMEVIELMENAQAQRLEDQQVQ